MVKMEMRVMGKAGRKQATDITTPPIRGMDAFCRQP